MPWLEKLVRAHDQEEEEQEMRIEQPRIRIELEGEKLDDDEQNAGDQRTPGRTQAAENHHLEGDQDAVDAQCRREGRAHGKQHAGDGCHGEGDAHDQRIDPLRIDAHQAHDLGIVRGGAHGLAEGRGVDRI
jgi:hypothetical protein